MLTHYFCSPPFALIPWLQGGKCVNIHTENAWNWCIFATICGLPSAVLWSSGGLRVLKSKQSQEKPKAAHLVAAVTAMLKERILQGLPARLVRGVKLALHSVGTGLFQNAQWCLILIWQKVLNPVASGFSNTNSRGDFWRKIFFNSQIKTVTARQ